MCICTYISDGEYTHPTNNEYLNELLQEVRQVTGDDWRLKERTSCYKPGWFRKLKCVKLYSLYNHLHSIEFQVINFYCDENDSSIHTMCSADVMAAYLLGILAYGNKSQSHLCS